ncbi:reverse transcriptase domain-containing protein [Tanacetum coccineum]
MMSQTCSTCGRENSTQPRLVFKNEDLLTEIFIRLPILCIYLFATISKQWLRILTSPDFTLSRRKIPNLDPSAGIFANHLRSLFKCDFVSLYSRLNSKKSTMDKSFSSVEEVDHVRILQSCNGLLLCTEGLNRQLKHYKFNFEDHDHPILTTIEIPHGLHKRMNFLKSFSDNSDDPILILMEIPHMLQLEGTFFEYLVNTKDFMNPLPEGWPIRSNVWSIGLGEREEDSFLVINLSGKVVKYNLISKTINEIFDIGSNQMDDDDDVEFIPPFSVDPNLYEFISSLTSV